MKMKKTLGLFNLVVGFCLFGDAQSGIPSNIEVCFSKGNCTIEVTGRVIQYPYKGCTDQRNCNYVSIRMQSIVIYRIMGLLF